MSAAAPSSSSSPPSIKTILLTGCNSGIGLSAAKILYQKGTYKLLLVARTLEKANLTKKTLLELNKDAKKNDDDMLVPFQCDMSSLASIESFATNLHEQFDGKIDVLCLNAGMCAARNSKATFTPDDGIEQTLATNHFGPYLLTLRLLDMMNSDDGSRIIITASSVHEKSTFGNFEGVTLCENNKPLFGFETLDGSDFDYFKAYAQSKLCNVAFCMELNRRLEQQSKDHNNNIVVNCFSPGLITSTGLFQHQNYVLRNVFGFFANYVFGFGETMEWGGGALAWMVTSEEAGQKGGQYWKLEKSGASRRGGASYGNEFHPMPISDEAANQENQSRLWKLSADLVGMDGDDI